MSYLSREAVQLACTLQGALKVCEALARERDKVEGGPEWRQALYERLVTKAKGTVMENIPIGDEPFFYDAIFAGIRIGLEVGRDNDT